MNNKLSKIFLAAIDMNRPLRGYTRFQSLLMENGLLVDMFVLAEGSAYELDEKLDASFVWIKSLESLGYEELVKKIVEGVKKGLNLLAHIGFKVKLGIIMALKKPALTHLRLCFHSNITT